MAKQYVFQYVYLRDATSTPRAPYSIHWESVDYPGLSACGRYTLLSDERYNPREVSQTDRCRASGCRQKWEAFDRERLTEGDSRGE